jgi:tetratricopeptide (TPR) repeat protein
MGPDFTGPELSSPGRSTSDSDEGLQARGGEVVTIATAAPAGVSARKYSPRILLAILAVAAAGATAFAWFAYSRRAPRFTERDTVLLADVANATGDPVFNETLRQALAVQLEQSPFLNIFSDQRLREALRYMGRSPDERVTKELAREICERQGLKALLAGSISPLGNHYVITLEALDGHTGEVLAREQVEAETKEQVLRALGAAASKLREKLGESLPSIQKFDVPLEQVTTSSLEALKAYTAGNELKDKGSYVEAVPFYKLAVELDPDFAVAHTRLASLYASEKELNLAAEAARTAFDLRQRVSEHEKFYISLNYYTFATGEIDKSIEVSEVWRQTYPHDVTPRAYLASLYSASGQYERAVEVAAEGISINPRLSALYYQLGTALMGLNRFDESREVFERALAQQLGSMSIHSRLYSIAFVRGDEAMMKQQIDWARGKPEEVDALGWQAYTAAFGGRLREAREINRRAGALAGQRGLAEQATGFATLNAAWSAIAGDCQQARADITRLSVLTKHRLALSNKADVLALCGAAGQAQVVVQELATRYPHDNTFNAVQLAANRAEIELAHGDPTQAIRLLEPASRYELGAGLELWPVYLRGQAYLRLRAGAEATAEFQKILDHRGIVPDSILYPLAQLGLARGAALIGDLDKSRRAYEAFFALWQDADSDLPALKQAAQEYKQLG